MSELIRPQANAWTRNPLEAELTGVCAAIARVLGIPAIAIRALFLAGGIALFALIPASIAFALEPLAIYSLGGIGGSTLLVYILTWWALPADSMGHHAILSELSAASVRGKPRLSATVKNAQRALVSPRVAVLRWYALAGILGAAVTLTMLGIGTLLPTLTGRWEGLAAGVGTLTAGAALGVLPLSLVDAARWSGSMSSLPTSVTFCIASGAALLLGGAMLAVLSMFGIKAMLVTLIASIMVIVLISIVLVPWVRRLWSGMREESQERALARHQAEIASHLHDSVLQTLTVIQREGMASEQMRRLARDQELELRRWLYGSVTGSASTSLAPFSERSESAQPHTFRETVEMVALEVERRNDVDIDVVCVGDCERTPGLEPLFKALREAAHNATRHGKVGVQIFADASSDILEVYIRDRGPGFDLSQIPEGRLGVRESIIGRMARAGGYARISPAIGGGTEVALTLEREGR